MRLTIEPRSKTPLQSLAVTPVKVRVSSKGQIVLPAEIRKKYGIEAGAHLTLVDMAGVIYLVPVGADPLGELTGMLGDIEGLSSEALLRERRAERDRDEAR